MKWTYKGKVSNKGSLKKPGFILDATFKKWLLFLLPDLIDEKVVITIENPPPKRKKKSKKVKKKK